MTEENEPKSGGKYPGYSRFEVKDRPDYYINQDWDLLEILPESNVVNESTYYDDRGYEKKKLHDNPFVLQTHRFLFGQKTDGVVAELKFALEREQSESYTHRREKEELEEKLETLEKQLEKQKAQTADAQQASQNNLNNYMKTEKKRQEAVIEQKAWEGKFNKLVKHYGEAAIERVLHPPKPEKNGPANRKVAL